MNSEPKRYLLGKGQELFEREKWKPRKIEPAQIYTLPEAKERLLPQLKSARQIVAETADRHCFDGTRAISVTVHPSFISKSGMPTKTLQAFGLDLLGSSAVKIRLKGANPKRSENPRIGMRLYVAGTPDAWGRYEKFVSSLTEDMSVEADYDKIRSEFKSIESIEAITRKDRIGEIRKSQKKFQVEVVLQKGSSSDEVLADFARLIVELGIRLDPLKVVDTSNLSFIPLEVDSAQLEEVAKYSHVRFIRSAAKIRTFRPTTRSRKVSGKNLTKPPNEVVCEDFRVAIFDGGLPNDELAEWVDYEDLTSGDKGQEFLDHGCNVTSAFFFGHLGTSPEVLETPPCRVDHYKVIGETDSDPYIVLNRIVNTLRSRNYKFANISLGPDYAVMDEHLDPWTVALDEIAESQGMFISVASGNGGEGDRVVGNHRIQPPSDGVNVIGVGAIDRFSTLEAKRSAYSSFGPGRCPGLVKPDLSVFGGSSAEPFGFVQSFSEKSVALDVGTSFASPLLLRAAAGIKARIQNEDLTPLAVKALILHHCRRESHHLMEEIGWGILPCPDPEAMITCNEGEVKVIYQGVRLGKKIVRTPIPLPDIATLLEENGLPDTIKAELRVTICLNSSLNPADSANYTRFGVAVTHRNKASDSDSTRTLFSKKAVFKFASEESLRSDSHKWATAIVGTDSLQVKSWEDPTLDFHFLERDRIGDSVGSASIPYAIIIGVRIPKIPDLYERVKERYQVLSPVRARVTQRVRLRE